MKRISLLKLFAVAGLLITIVTFLLISSLHTNEIPHPNEVKAKIADLSSESEDVSLLKSAKIDFTIPTSTSISTGPKLHNFHMQHAPVQTEKKISEILSNDGQEYLRDLRDRYRDDSSMKCKTSFEPTCPMYPYVRFWNKQFHAMDCYESPLRPKLKERTPLSEQKFVVLEPDCGRLNNMRMAAEVAILFAHATGRTLVLPPVDPRFMFNSDEKRSPIEFIFNLTKLSESMNFISMQSFLENVARIPGQLKQPLPPNTNISAFMHTDRPLWDYIDEATYSERWEPGIKFIGFNISSNYSNLFGTFDQNINSNIRYKLMVAHGRKLRPYDSKLHEEKAIFLRGTCRKEEQRILTHFYTYLYFADPHISRIYSRIVRDRLHYHDSIFCAAGMIVKAIHEEASKLTGKAVQRVDQGDKKTMGGNTNQHATYFAMHVRRGDILVQGLYDNIKLNMEQMVNDTFHLFDPTISPILYISTDERDLSIFQPFRTGKFQLRFLSDYYTPETTNENHIGMIEQIVCANSFTFVGSPLSSFTGYINRMRGERCNINVIFNEYLSKLHVIS